MRAGADDHCTEQDDDKVIVRADESEAQDGGGINTDAVAGNSALESTGRTTKKKKKMKFLGNPEVGMINIKGL